MPVTTPAEFLDALRRHHLLEPEQLEELGTKHTDLKAMGQDLVRRGWLTVWQVNQVAAGRGASLLLDPYLLLDVIGEGGMGHVFKARHRRLERLAALKVIHKDRVANDDAVKRFHREAKAAARLDHPNIVKVFDANEEKGVHFLAMEFVDGKDLSKLVKEKGPLPIKEACDYIRQAAQGLQHAHEQGLVHRDIKPGNLLLTSKGSVVKILDMGLARFTKSEEGKELTQEGTVMGSLDYIAPEQAMDSHAVDIRADLYSLGCTFYYLLAGQVPFPGGEATAKLLKHQMEEPRPVEQLRPDIPPSVAAIVRKLLAKKPANRYQTPAEVVAAIGVINESPPPAGEQTLSTNERWAQIASPANTVEYSRPVQRKRGAMLIGLLGILLVAVGVAGWMIVGGMTKGVSRDKIAEDSSTRGSNHDHDSSLPARYKNSLGMEFALVPKGKSWLGGGGGRPGDKEVEIKDDFYLGVYEVTQEEWEMVMGANPSIHKSGHKSVADVPPDDLLGGSGRAETPSQTSVGRMARYPGLSAGANHAEVPPGSIALALRRKTAPCHVHRADYWRRIQRLRTHCLAHDQNFHWDYGLFDAVGQLFT